MVPLLSGLLPVGLRGAMSLPVELGWGRDIAPPRGGGGDGTLPLPVGLRGALPLPVELVWGRKQYIAPPSGAQGAW